MHAAIQLLVLWAVAFVTLCLAVYLMAIFDAVIENDLELLSLGREAALAGLASFIEALGAWLVMFLVQAPYRGQGLRAMLLPAVIVAMLYKIAHLQDWNRYDVLLLLLFQLAIGCVGTSLLTAHFASAVLALVFFGVLLAGIAFWNKSM